MKSHEIWVNPVKRTSPQGRHKQAYSFIDSNQNLVTTRTMDKIKEDNVTEVFHFPRHPELNKLVTGLDKLIDNPFYGSEVDEIKLTYGLGAEWETILKVIVNNPKIKKQTYYEILDNRTPNYYTDEVTYNMMEPLNYKKGVERNFLETFNVILYPRPNRFSSDSSRGRLAIELFHVLRKVAKTEGEINPSIHDWYISEENTSQIENKKKRDIYQKAMALMYDLKSSSTEWEMYKIASILKYNSGEPVVRGEISKGPLEEKLSAYLDDNGSSQLEYLHNFIKLTEDNRNPEGAVFNLVKYSLQQAINKGVITFRDGNYIWHSKSNQPSLYKITSDYDKLIAFFVKEYNIYNPKDSETSNWWIELKNELVNHGVRFE